jgi:hypothetical protein
VGGRLIRDDVKNGTFEAMRSQSRPSVDSRSLIEYCAVNEGSPLESRCKGAHDGMTKPTFAVPHMHEVSGFQDEQPQPSFPALWV